jgi:hypothetical protein
MEPSAAAEDWQGAAALSWWSATRGSADAPSSLRSSTASSASVVVELRRHHHLRERE